MLRYFGFSAFLTIAAVITAGLTLGMAAALTTLVLIAIEIAFSFDNAVINAKVLARLSPAWQRLFLTVGMVIAIVGMRLVFPILIVMVTADLSWRTVVGDALHHPKEYGDYLAAAHDSIAAFGGGFLLTLTLYFLFDDNNEEVWLRRIERPLQNLKSGLWLPPLIVATATCVIAVLAPHQNAIIFHAGLLGVATYVVIKLLVDGLNKISGSGPSSGNYVGWGAFLAFVYLEVLDASFSFDGVLGAFAITDKVILIGLGLGVGAVWVRSLTVYMVRKGTLDTYKYLEHGAHYAILVLAIALLGSIFYEVPDAITGVVGLGIIAASFQASREARHPKPGV